MGSAFALFIAIAIPLAIGAVGGISTANAIPNWYSTLTKPSWNPPNWLFGPVWTLLYVLMGVAAWIVWRKVGFVGSPGWWIADGIQLFLNFWWSILFFGKKQIGWALVEIIAMWVSIVATISVFWQIDPLAAKLLVPYIAWVSFATFLNFTIWRLNRSPSPARPTVE